MSLTQNTVSLIYEFVTSSLFVRQRRLLQSYKCATLGATLKHLCAFVITKPTSFTFYVSWARYDKACAIFCQTTFFVQYNGYSVISPREEARLKSHKPIVQLRTLSSGVSFCFRMASKNLILMFLVIALVMVAITSARRPCRSYRCGQYSCSRRACRPCNVNSCGVGSCSRRPCGLGISSSSEEGCGRYNCGVRSCSRRRCSNSCLGNSCRRRCYTGTCRSRCNYGAYCTY